MEPERKAGRKAGQPKARRAEELDAFFSAINRRSTSGKRFYAIAVLTRATGMRIGEVLDLTLPHLDLMHGIAYLPDSKTGTDRQVIITRMGEVREAMSDWLDVRQGWNPKSDLVFVTRPGLNHRTHKASERVEYRSVVRAFETVSKRAGLAHPVTPHQLRHTWASIAIGKGAPITGVSKQLGHKNPNITTGVYAWAINKEQQDAARMVDGD